MTETFMSRIPEHRQYVNRLISNGSIDHYVVSMESQRVWITLNAEDKNEVTRLLEGSPLHTWWEYEVEELFVFDGQQYRMPELNPN